MAPTDVMLAEVFNLSFGDTYNVRCLGGFSQPEYLTAMQTQGSAQLRYTRDYAASALHEIAHWCVAGKDRLALNDFGYGYLPPPRDKATQQRFFALEFKVQVLEAWFASGTGVRFVASADNFDCSDEARNAFAQQITTAVQAYTLADVPPRAQEFTRALATTGLGVWPGVNPQPADASTVEPSTKNNPLARHGARHA